MKRKMTVSIQADVPLEMTKEEEKIIRKMRNAENSEDWDSYTELKDKLEALIAKRILKEMESIEDVTVDDISYE